MALDIIVPSSFESAVATFIAANGTAAKVLIESFPAAAAAANAPAFFGGCSVVDLTASSTDTAAKDVLIYHGLITTTQETTATGVMSTTSSTVARLAGSFISDGYKVGDSIMLFAPKNTAPNAAVDGVFATITAVSALTLTVNGTPFAALTLAAGTRVCRVSLDLRATIAIAAGTNGSTANVGLLNHNNDGSLLRYERKLGVAEVLIAAMQAAVTALPCYVTVSAQLARY